tara:strand:+ start:1077 stop:1244 length:168 start_codon:yes stop_codon:yes gene_type:complete
MFDFDPAINYGPNDAGVSTASIILAVVGLLAVSWLFGAIYGLLANYFNNNKTNNK